MNNDSNNDCCCCTAVVERNVVACSGASNVGQVSNLVAVKMTQAGLARMTCLAALGAHLPAFIESVKDTEMIVVDGCPNGCARLIMDHIGVTGYKYFVITKMGVEKAKRFDQIEKDSEQIWDKIIELI